MHIDGITKVKHNEMMSQAIYYAELSKCKRRKVGCVIMRPNDTRPLYGYNRTLDGGECEEYHITCESCEKRHRVNSRVEYNKKCDCSRDIAYIPQVDISKLESKTLDTTMHAEQVALMYACKKGYKLEGGVMYVTTSPCVICAKLIALSGIKQVIYKDSYSDRTGIELLVEHGVKVTQFQ